MEAEGSEEWQGYIEGFFGNRGGGCGRGENFVKVLFDKSVNYVAGVSILLEICG